MGAAIVGGAIIVGAAGTAYFGYEASKKQAEAAEEAAEIQAEAAVRSAQIAGNASRQSTEMQVDAMRDVAQMQQDIARMQMEQAERFAVREELRMVTGQAAKDTFDRVAGAFVSWAQGNDIAQEQRLLEQFGLENETNLQPPPQDPSLWEMMNTDLLTGDTTNDDNPYRLEGDLGHEMDAEMNRLYPEETPPTPPSAADGPLDYPDGTDPDALLDEAERLARDAGSNDPID